VTDTTIEEEVVDTAHTEPVVGKREQVQEKTIKTETVQESTKKENRDVVEIPKVETEKPQPVVESAPVAVPVVIEEIQCSKQAVEEENEHKTVAEPAKGHKIHHQPIIQEVAAQEIKATEQESESAITKEVRAGGEAGDTTDEGTRQQEVEEHQEQVSASEEQQ